MPARFFFDLVSDLEVIRDEEGVSAEDLGTAIAEATEEIADMRRSGKLGEDARAWQLVIRNEQGDEIQRLPL